MTQEEKELLLKVLCAMRPYKLHCRVFRLNGDIKENDDILYGVIGDNAVILKSDKDECLMYYQIKPYLRPLSSMTDDEFQELHSICPHSTINKTNNSGWIVGISGSDYGRISRVDEISDFIDWLNEHHFDYRGLIEMGLALEAPEGKS